MQVKLTNLTQNNRALTGGGPIQIVPFADNGAALILDAAATLAYADDIRSTFRQRAIQVELLDNGDTVKITKLEELEGVFQHLKSLEQGSGKVQLADKP